MTKTLACALVASLLFAASLVLPVTAAQDRTSQPGQPTQARMWIQNRGDTEAVPVTIQNMTNEAPPLRVQIVGVPSVIVGAASGEARATRRIWEYQSVTILSGQDPTAALNAAGLDGWEATGLGVPRQGGMLVVMKRHARPGVAR